MILLMKKKLVLKNSLTIREKERKLYKKVACGGTFDHFHSGHKVLLTSAVLMSSEEVVIGISDGELLKNKKFKEVLQSFEYRQKKS